MKKFVFYDTETTGLVRDFDQILQFAAILTDANFREIDRFEVRCQCLPWVIPSPMALWVTGVQPAMLTDPNLPSFYEMIDSIAAKLKSWSPAIFLGYNTIHFDEPILQRAFWQALLPPYLTVMDGNSRMDVLPLIKAASHLAKGAFNYPHTLNGRKGFSLDSVAPLNGFNHENAHDALADVEATIHIASLLSERAPRLWHHAATYSPKAQTSKLLQEGRPVLIVEYFMNGPSVWWGQRIDTRGDKGSAANLVRLSSDWKSLSNSNNSDLIEFLSQSPKPLRQIGLNKAPLVFEENQAREYWGFSLSSDERTQSEFLAREQEFCKKVVSVADRITESWPKSEHLEQMIYSGFPSNIDVSSMKKFHQENLEGRVRLIKRFQDIRFQKLAERRIYTQRPDLLTQNEVSLLEKRIAERFHSDIVDKKLWRTIAMARAELETVRAKTGTEVFVSKVSTWLDNLENRFPLKGLEVDH